jgi:hypothetical protein
VEGAVAHGDMPLIRRRVLVGYVPERFRVVYLLGQTLDNEIKRLLFDGQGATRVEGEVLGFAGALTCAKVQSAIHPDGQDRSDVRTAVRARRCEPVGGRCSLQVLTRGRPRRGRGGLAEQ